MIFFHKTVYLSIGYYFGTYPLRTLFCPFLHPASIKWHCEAVQSPLVWHIAIASPAVVESLCSKQMEAQSQWRHKSDSSSNAIKLVSKTMNKWVKNPGLCTCKFPCSRASYHTYTYSNNWARTHRRGCFYLLLVSCLQLHYGSLLNQKGPKKISVLKMLRFWYFARIYGLPRT